MKNILLLAFVVLAPLISKAQSEKDDIAIIQSLYGKNKRELMQQYLKIPEAQSAEFWKTYEAYEAERKKISQKSLMLINDYGQKYPSLDDATAEKLAGGLLDNNTAQDKLNKKYFKKFSKASSPVKAAEFMQLELYLQNSIKTEIAESIPFLGEIEQSKK